MIKNFGISHKELTIQCDKMSNKVIHENDSLVISLEPHDKDFLTSKEDSKREKERDTHTDVNYSNSSGDIAMKRKIKELEKRNCKLVKANEQLKERLADVKQDLKTKERDFEREKNKQFRDHQNIEENFSKKFKNITDDKRKLQKKCDDFAEKNLKLSQDNNKLDLEKKELKTELNCLRLSFDSKEQRIEQLIKEMAQLDLQLKKEERDKHYYYIQAKKAKKTQNLEDSIVPLSSDLENQTICSTAPQPLQDKDETPLLSAAIIPVKSHNSEAAQVQEIYKSNKEIITRRMWQISNQNNMPHKNINQQKLSDFVDGIESGSNREKIFLQNVLRPKLTWIRSLLSGRKDIILIKFIDSILNLKI